MHKKIKQRFSLSHSTTETTPEPMRSYNESIVNSNQSSKPPKHKKKKSLVETFKNFPPFHGTKHSENKHKITDLTMPKQIKKSMSFSHGNNSKKMSLYPNVKKKKTKHRSQRSNSFGTNNNDNGTISTVPEAEEEKIDYGDDFSGDDINDDSITKSFSFSPSPKHTVILKKSKSQNVFTMSHRHSIQSPALTRSPRTFVEHEKNTLIAQMRQLQSSMVQLGDMLRNQDKNLVKEKGKNEKLTEQINNLADENINLRAQLQKLRQNQQSVWGDLEFYKLAARSRRDKNLLLSNQLNIVETQKTELSNYSQQLLQQLNAEKEKNRALTIRIRKYSKNVKSLHKKTSSLSGISKYTRNEYNKFPLINAVSNPCDEQTQSIDIQLDIVKDNDTPSPAGSFEGNNSVFEQKKRELKHLEEQTLEILNQLQADTRTLLGDTKGMKSRNKNRINNKKRKKKKKENDIDNNDHNKSDDIVITTKTKTKKKTTTKTQATINGSNIDITTSKIETKSKTKTKKIKTKINVKSDEKMENSNSEGNSNSSVSDTNTNTNTNTNAGTVTVNECDIGTENDFRNPINDKSQSNSSQEWDSGSDDEGLVHVNNSVNKKRKSIDLDENNENNNAPSEMTLISDDDEDELDEVLINEQDMEEINKQAKEDVKTLKKCDAPVSLLFAAFEKQMASERTDSESENENSNSNNNNGNKSKSISDDGPSVASQFANFNGFSSDEDDGANNALEDLWN